MAPFEWKILYNLGIIHLTMQQYLLKALSVIPFFFLFTDKLGLRLVSYNQTPLYGHLVITCRQFSFNALNTDTH